MENIFIQAQLFANILWQAPMVYLLLGTGAFVTILFILPQVRFFAHAISVITLKYLRVNPELFEQPSSFLAFCRHVSAPIGLGSVAGVAIALTTGGPGAVFWMWITGFLGMATKFASIAISVHYRSSITKIGPMYTWIRLDNLLGKVFAMFFAICAVCVAFTSGNLFQANQVAAVLSYTWKIPHLYTGIALAVLTLFILLKQKNKIADFISKFAPTIALFYAFGAITVMFQNADKLAEIFSLIINSAFEPLAIPGAVVGFGVKEAMSQGVRRALFSNEAGLGSAALNNRKMDANPIQEGIVGMLGPMIDTIIVSTLTAVVLIMSDLPLYTTGMQSVELTVKAFKVFFGDGGMHLITLLVTFFAFTTIIAWAELGEKCFNFIFQDRYKVLFRIVYSMLLGLGAISQLAVLINFSDIFLALMAIPNLLLIIFLSPKMFKLIKKYRSDVRARRI